VLRMVGNESFRSGRRAERPFQDVVCILSVLIYLKSVKPRKDPIRRSSKDETHKRVVEVKAYEASPRKLAIEVLSNKLAAQRKEQEQRGT